MRKLLTILLAMGLILVMAACGEDDALSTQQLEEVGSAGEKVQQTTAPVNDVLYEVLAGMGIDSVVYEVGKKSDTRAEIHAEVPDYTELFLAALESEDPENALADLIREGKYSTVPYDGVADVVTGSDGQETILVEPLLELFIDKELVRAINTVTANMGEGEGA